MTRWERRRGAGAAAELVTGELSDGIDAVPLVDKDGVSDPMKSLPATGTPVIDMCLFRTIDGRLMSILGHRWSFDVSFRTSMGV